MRILLTNDDGILAPGLAALYRELTKIGHVDVVAPSTVQSATGHGITIRDPLTVRKIHVHNEFHGHSVTGRPADCVKLAVAELLDEKPDLVVSGINDGANASINVLYSGTVAAAAEGAILRIPSIAVSMEWGDEMDFERAAGIAQGIIASYADTVKSGKPVCPLLNLNIPTLKEDWPKGLKVLPQAALKADDRYEKTENPDGTRQYSLSGWFSDFGSNHYDLGALQEGYVVLTPLYFDMTDHGNMEAVQNHDWPKVR